MKFLRVSRERKKTRQGGRGPNDRPIPTSAVIPRDKFEVLLSGVCQFTTGGYAPGLRIVATSIVSEKKKRQTERSMYFYSSALLTSIGKYRFVFSSLLFFREQTATGGISRNFCFEHKVDSFAIFVKSVQLIRYRFYVRNTKLARCNFHWKHPVVSMEFLLKIWKGIKFVANGFIISQG